MCLIASAGLLDSTSVDGATSLSYLVRRACFPKRLFGTRGGVLVVMYGRTPRRGGGRNASNREVRNTAGMWREYCSCAFGRGRAKTNTTVENVEKQNSPVKIDGASFLFYNLIRGRAARGSKRQQEAARGSKRGTHTGVKNTVARGKKHCSKRQRERNAYRSKKHCHMLRASWAARLFMFCALVVVVGGAIRECYDLIIQPQPQKTLQVVRRRRELSFSVFVSLFLVRMSSAISHEGTKSEGGAAAKKERY